MAQKRKNRRILPVAAALFSLFCLSSCVTARNVRPLERGQHAAGLSVYSDGFPISGQLNYSYGFSDKVNGGASMDIVALFMQAAYGNLFAAYQFDRPAGKILGFQGIATGFFNLDKTGICLYPGVEALAIWNLHDKLQTYVSGSFRAPAWHLSSNSDRSGLDYIDASLGLGINVALGKLDIGLEPKITVVLPFVLGENGELQKMQAETHPGAALNVTFRFEPASAPGGGRNDARRKP